MRKFLTLDCETGGLSSETSLLTAYFGIMNENYKLIDELYLKLVPDDGIYKVTASGLYVNKIDLTKLQGIPYKQGGTLLYNFLDKHRIENKLTPVGQNIQFDIERVTQDLLSKGSWENYVSRRVLDTMVIAKFLQSLDKIPNELSISLTSLTEYLNIEIPTGEAHEARYDALCTVRVLQKMQELARTY